MRDMRPTPLLYILLFATLLTSQYANAQANAGNLFFAKVANGMNIVMQPLPSTNNAEVTLYIKTGSVYETDSLSGISNVIQHILSEKIASSLRSNKGGINFSNTLYNSYATSEQTIYKFSGPAGYISTYLGLLRDSVFLANIRPVEIDSATGQVKREMAFAEHDPQKIFNDKIIKAVFRQDYYKASIAGDPDHFQYIDNISVKHFMERYYVPNNAIISGAGNISASTFQGQAENAFRMLIKSEFDPESITKIIDFRPIIYNTQFIVNDDSVQTPEFQICWQFPGAFSSTRASYCGFLISALLNDPNNYIQIKAAKMGCKKLSAQYEANNFNGIFRVTLQADTQNVISIYKFVVNEISNMHQTLINESMVNAAKVIFKREYQGLAKTKAYSDFAIRYWPYKDETYFLNLIDSAMSVTEKELRTFAFDYLNRGAYVAGLMISENDRKSLNIDSTFTDIDEKVANYIFTYRENITDLEGGDNLSKQRNLLQWLLANKDMYVKINGYADEGEFNKAYDDTVLAFIDSVETFRRTMPDIIKKGYLRPEMMRAMKIIKYLYENGIEAERLSGTSMLAHSDNKREAAENMKCTLILDKFRNRLSYYGSERPVVKPRKP